MGDFLHLLGFFLFGLSLLFFINLFDLWLIAFLLLLFLFLFFLLGIRHFLLFGFLYVELDGEANEFRVLLDQILKAALLEELRLVLLEVANHFGSTFHLTVHHLCILLNSEGTTSSRLPDVLLIIVVLADDAHLVRDQVRRVEADAELADHRDVATCSHGLHEGLGPRFGDGAQVVDELILSHANARVLNGDGRVCLVRNDLDVEVGLCLNLLRICDGLVANLIESI
mmetsp:Transcript_116080/g.189073  ORF Transcript_116080/g.189073 Transcript_116080/m.189073 type:complete len:227 (+) Transcript_116080:88-768(+)